MPGIPAALDRDFASVTNVTDVRGADILRRLTMMYFTEHRVEEAGETFRDDRNNDYSCFDEFGDDIGVYVFQHRDTGGVLYVGESHKISHPLKERISQHYTPGNTGGTFRRNWCKANCRKEACGDKRKCSNACNPSFMRFKCLIRRSRIIIFSFGRNNNGVFRRICG